MEWGNGLLFSFRYPRLRAIASRILHEQHHPEFDYSLVAESDLDSLVSFFAAQPAERFTHFKPHKFDRRDLSRLLRNDAFLMMKITRRSSGAIIGYFFLRCFFIGKAFHGLMADWQCRGLQLGASMWEISEHICRESGLKMFATVSASNLPSLNSASRGTDVSIVETLPNGYYLIECRQKSAI